MAPRKDAIREKVQASKDIREGVRKELDHHRLTVERPSGRLC
jgi:hypothetical protein